MWRQVMQGVLVALMLMTLGTRMHAQQRELLRVARPFVFKVGLEGVGIDVTIVPPLAVDLTTFGFYHSAKLRVLLLQRDATPFVGIGCSLWGEIGYEGQRFAVVHAGYEISLRSVVVQALVQYPLYTRKPDAGGFIPVGVNLGYRF